MREIKFRAWDGKHKKWMWPYPDAFWIIGEVTVFNLLDQAEDMSLQDYNDIQICQYTGLKDNGGKEKFADDINRISWCNGFAWGTGYILGVVEQQKGAWGLRVLKGNNVPKGKDFVPFYMFEGEPDEDRIIGNIYETPELLDAK